MVKEKLIKDIEDHLIKALSEVKEIEEYDSDFTVIRELLEHAVDELEYIME